MFRLRAVRKRYGEALAVDGVDLEIRSGRCTVLLGPSGCGKSTILRLLNGLLTPSEGSVEFAGEPVGRQGEAGLRSLRRRIGYVIQDGGLFPHLTVRQNVGLAAHFGDHVVLLRAGRVVQQGGFRELIEAPASDFVGDFVNAQRQLHEVDA